MNFKIQVLAGIVFVLAVSYAAAENSLSSKAEELITEAKKVQLEAVGIGKELRVKTFQVDKVKGMLDVLVGHVEAIERIAAELASFETQMSSEQKTKYEAIKVKSQILTIFAKNKKDMLMGEDPSQNRAMLRAKADGIAKRAEMLQQSAMVLRK